MRDFAQRNHLYLSMAVLVTARARDPYLDPTSRWGQATPPTSHLLGRFRAIWYSVFAPYQEHQEAIEAGERDILLGTRHGVGPDAYRVRRDLSNRRRKRRHAPIRRLAQCGNGPRIQICREQDVQYGLLAPQVAKALRGRGAGESCSVAGDEGTLV